MTRWMRVFTFAILILSRVIFTPSLSLANSESQNASDVPDIVGGIITTPGAWPWQVRLEISIAPGGLSHGGGILIDQQWVLTAAHVVGGLDATIAPDTIIVHLGDHDTTFIEPDEQIRTVDSIIVHPDFRRNPTNNDIALLHLSTPANIAQKVQIAKFAQDGLLTAPGIHATVIGWGHTRADPGPDANSTLLRQTDVDIVSNATCNSTFTDSPITDNMLCAGRSNGSTNHCAGDSGGPLMTRDVRNMWNVVGIVSWRVSYDNNGCGVIPEVPYGIYARVSVFSKWIESHIRPFSSFLPIVGSTSQPVERSSLGPNEQLLVNQRLVSPDGRFILLMQGDGNLVLYEVSGGPLWSTETVGSGAIRVEMQYDGHLVLYTTDGTPVSAISTVGGISTLRLQNDGNLVIYRYGTIPVWDSNPGPTDLGSDQSLQFDQGLYSLDGRFRLVMQFDGNLVLYRNDGNVPLWATETTGQGGSYLYMQNDGNLVIYRANGEPVWSSNTVGGISTLRLQDDGNLVIYRDGVGAVWATNTGP